MQHFQFSALDAEAFAAYFSKTDEELAQLHAKRVIADARPGFPCRVSLEDAEVGETLLLLPFVHHDVEGPYRSGGPVFIRENAARKFPAVDEIPAVLRHRTLSLRGYDRSGMMVHAAVAEGRDLPEILPGLFENQAIDYIHVHNAKPGCFSCSVRRADQ